MIPSCSESHSHMMEKSIWKTESFSVKDCILGVCVRISSSLEVLFYLNLNFTPCPCGKKVFLYKFFLWEVSASDIMFTSTEDFEK